MDTLQIGIYRKPDSLKKLWYLVTFSISRVAVLNVTVVRVARLLVVWRREDPAALIPKVREKLF